MKANLKLSLIVIILFCVQANSRAQDLSNFNLLAHYSLINTAEDQTGNYGDIILINTPFQGDEGIYSNGNYIGGDSDSCAIQTPKITELDFTDLLISVEFKIDEIITTKPIIIAGPSWRWMGAFVNSNDSTLHMSYNNRNDSRSNEVKVAPGQWHTLGLSYSAGTGYLFLNGEKVDSIDFELNSPDSDKAIGNSNGGNGKTYKGNLRQLKVYGPKLTGINTSDFSQIEEIVVYPNPSKGIFKLRIHNSTKSINNIEVLNLQGRSILSFENASNDIEIDISEYPNGIYFVRVNNRLHHKIQKQ